MKPYDAGLWVGFNLLVDGPPGSGKLSIVKGLSVVTNPLADIRIYDFETEPDIQAERIADCIATLDSMVSGQSDVVYILRHIHRLRRAELDQFLEALWARVSVSLESSRGENPIRVHATSYDTVRWTASMREKLQTVFPCWIHLTDQCANQWDLKRFVRQVVDDLNRRYHREVTEVDVEIVDELRRGSSRSLHEMRNFIERVYVASPGRRLSKACLSDIA